MYYIFERVYYILYIIYIKYNIYHTYYTMYIYKYYAIWWRYTNKLFEDPANSKPSKAKAETAAAKKTKKRTKQKYKDKLYNVTKQMFSNSCECGSERQRLRNFFAFWPRLPSPQLKHQLMCSWSSHQPTAFSKYELVLFVHNYIHNLHAKVGLTNDDVR